MMNGCDWQRRQPGEQVEFVQIFSIKSLKIYFHFSLAMPENPRAIMDSSDFKRKNFLEKSFRSIVNSGRLSTGKQSERLLGSRFSQGTSHKAHPCEELGNGIDREGRKEGRKEGNALE
jgi:hypothetical protein